MRLAVFDCDGTLVDGQAAVCEAMEAAFATVGLPQPPRTAIRRIVGLSLTQAVHHLAPSADPLTRAKTVEAYKAAFRASRDSGTLDEPLFEGMAELLTELRDRGWTLAVATGKSDRGLLACLKEHGIAEYFVSLQTADRHPSKPHPAMLDAALLEAGAAPHEAVMIGDTTFDIVMAGAAGVRAIGVTWGYHSADELIAAGADAVAADTQELRTLIYG